ncbi:transmembrane protein 18-domain-containing protein [Pelagophyceae sp. CCMP2097]|nr:transmembrane protein 18-domain-containing protein [Pelagophyceae sp. CCMP2097]|mmetsp:Transcript_15441/g.52075  ORF Transcript_15441/g.52075 Transcript_15441/m.52075 type:complete len:198 (-) Transcript_15441:24-617(-)
MGDEAPEGDFADMMEGIQDFVFDAARKSGNGPQGFLENVAAFSAAVDWTEPWLRAVVCFHCVLWVFTLATRRRHNVQYAIFFLVTLLVGGAERLNKLGAIYWKTFSKNDYFDEHGVFAGVIFCLPLLALAMFQLFNFLYMASNLLIDVKRTEIRRAMQKDKERQRKKNDGDAATAPDAAPSDAAAQNPKKKKTNKGD